MEGATPRDSGRCLVVAYAAYAAGHRQRTPPESRALASAHTQTVPHARPRARTLSRRNTSRCAQHAYLHAISHECADTYAVARKGNGVVTRPATCNESRVFRVHRRKHCRALCLDVNALAATHEQTRSARDLACDNFRMCGHIRRRSQGRTPCGVDSRQRASGRKCALLRARGRNRCRTRGPQRERHRGHTQADARRRAQNTPSRAMSHEHAPSHAQRCLTGERTHE